MSLCELVGTVEDDRSVRAATFDEDALLYDRARPTYPPALFDAIDRRLAVAAPRTLEIGCGTGQATASLVERGHRVLAVELGPALAEVARRKLAASPHVEVVTADVEQWDPATPPGVRLPAVGDLPAASAYGIEGAGQFHSADTRRFGVDLHYDAEAYLDLLDTFSNHRALSATRREGLFACVRRRIAREPGGTVVRSVAFELSTAFRCSG